jgi:hypothetical protein
VAGEARTLEARLACAAKPSEDALRRYALCRGKMQTLPKCPVRGFEDFAVWYSPGVAAPASAIAADPEAVWVHTNRDLGVVRLSPPGTLTLMSFATSRTPITRRAASCAASRLAQLVTVPVSVTTPASTSTPTSVSSTRESHRSSSRTSRWICVSVFFAF